MIQKEKKISEKATDTHASHHSSWGSPTEGWGVGRDVDPGWAPEKIRTLADTGKFFTGLTKEKDQTEAALSQMPQLEDVILQTRFNQEALEHHGERMNPNWAQGAGH